jgi:hypothetical protein
LEPLDLLFATITFDFFAQTITCIFKEILACY